MDCAKPQPNVAESQPEFVEALAKELTILESFVARHGEMTLSEVARRAGIPPSPRGAG